MKQKMEIRKQEPKKMLDKVFWISIILMTISAISIGAIPLRYKCAGSTFCLLYLVGFIGDLTCLFILLWKQVFGNK
jgi:hypothetical protein